MCSKNQLFVLFFFSFITINLVAVEISISNNVNGLLNTRIEKSLQNQITKLTVEGQIDARDFKFMRDSLTILESVDLKNTIVLVYQGDKGTSREPTTYLANSIPHNGFSYTPANGIPVGKLSLVNLILPNTIQKIGIQAFSICSNLKTIEYPENVIRIGEQAFAGCVKLESFPLRADTLDESCFQNCESLVGTLNLPAELSKIGISAFDGCFNIQNIIFNSSISTIPEFCFYNCTLLESIYFDKTVDTILQDAFAGCPAIKSISCLHTLPPIINSQSFPDIIRGNCSVYVAPENIETYKSSTWAGFKILSLNSSYHAQTYRNFGLTMHRNSIAISTDEVLSIDIYNLSGKVCYRGKSIVGTLNIPLQLNELYFLSVNKSKAFKLFLQR